MRDKDQYRYLAAHWGLQGARVLHLLQSYPLCGHLHHLHPAQGNQDGCGSYFLFNLYSGTFICFS